MRAICPRCVEHHLQRWLVDPARPSTMWSLCTACGWIAVWTDGRLELPQDVGGAEAESVFADAIVKVLDAVRAGRDRAGRNVEHLRAELAREMAEMEPRRAFLDQFRFYQQNLRDQGRARASNDA